MGASSSVEAAELPYPVSWLPKDATAADHKSAAGSLKAISAIDPERFLAIRAPLPELEDTAYEFGNFKEFAAAAIAADIGLNRLVYKCVPKRVPETEFWRCFFCVIYREWNASCLSTSLVMLACHAGAKTDRHLPVIGAVGLPDHPGTIAAAEPRTARAG